MFWYRIANTECQNQSLNPNSPGFGDQFDAAYLCEFNRAKVREEKLRRALEHAAGQGSRYDGKVLIDIKKCPSAKGKFVKKKYQRVSDMPDILRAAVLIPKGGPTLHECATDICRKLSSCDWEAKEDKKSGYRGIYHLHAEIDGMGVEIQVNFKGAWSGKEIAHLSYKGDEDEIPCGSLSSSVKNRSPLVDIEGNQYPRAMGPKTDAEMKDVLSGPVKAPQAAKKRERQFHELIRNPAPLDFTSLRGRPISRDVSREAFNLRRMKIAAADPTGKGVVDYVAMVNEAMEFARNAHKGQKRNAAWEDHGADYFVHPERVAKVAQELGLPPQVVMAAYLHDVAEDTPVTIEEIEAKFGQEVSSMVSGLTNPSKKFPNLPRAERKKMDREHVLTVHENVKIIKALDRIDNLNDFDMAPKDFKILYSNESLLLADALLQGDPSPRLVKLVTQLKELASRLASS